jgi:aquaporin Z
VTGCTAEANASYILTALAFGLVIVAMAYSIGNISGCHINPAVSIGVLLNGGMDVTDFIGYVAAQFLGAIAGAAILRSLIGTGLGLGCNGLYDGSIVKSLVVEIILTCIFVLAVLGANTGAEIRRRKER